MNLKVAWYGELDFRRMFHRRGRLFSRIAHMEVCFTKINVDRFGRELLMSFYSTCAKGVNPKPSQIIIYRYPWSADIYL